MTREQIIDLLTLARVYDARVTIGQAETAAWFLAVQRIPFDIAQQAVTEHYTAPIEPGASYPRIAPGHVYAYWQAQLRYQPHAEISGPKPSPEHVAKCRADIDALIKAAAARFAPPTEDDEVPRWHPGADKQELARQQAVASQQRRERGAI